MLFRDPFVVLDGQTAEKPLYSDFTDTTDKQLDVSTLLRRASRQFSLREKLYPISTELECFSESEPASPASAAPAGPIRILMLHGYTQSGHFFNTKTRKLRERIMDNLREELCLEESDEIEFLYPDAPHVLHASEVPGHYSAAGGESDLHGWFNINDQPFQGLEASIAWIIQYMRLVGPVDGVIGFSQGGAMAMMIASLCEGQTNPARLEALANQPISMHFEPPQGPMKFAISVSGFRGTTDHYRGFYNPIITTPSMCIVADLDIMIEADVSALLVESCHEPKVVRHRGGHYVPTDNKSLDAAAKCVGGRMAER